MIVDMDHLPWWRTFTGLRGSVLPRIYGRVAFTTAIAVGVTYWHTHGGLGVTLTTTPFSLIGLALGIILGFRNNTSFQRFWEGRILWGRTVNTSRTFARQVLTLIGSRDEAEAAAVRDEQRLLIRRQAAYVHALRLHLRRQRDLSSLQRLLPDDDLAALSARSNPPIALLQGLGDRLAAAWRKGWIDPLHLPTLEGSLSQLTDHQGGCERILNTPIPYSYSLLIHRLVAVYCLTLPMGIVQQVVWMTPFVVLLVGYAFYGLDAIGDSIEEPFGGDMNDLPLDQLSTMIEINVRESIGDTDLPPPVVAVDHVLR